MRRPKAHSSSCSQIALVYLQPVRRSSPQFTLEVRGAAKNCKKNNETPYFLEFKVFKSYRCWYD